MGIDPTVAAAPFFNATMALEHRWLKRHADDPRFDQAQYDRADATANLALALGSVVVPLAYEYVRRPMELGRGRAAKPLLGLAAAGAAAATAADAVARRRRRRQARHLNDRVDTAPTLVPHDATAERIETAAGALAAASIGTATLVAAATWAGRTSPKRLWEHRVVDLGSGAAAWAFSLVAWDFLYYWNHRFQHESRYLWAIHVVHHNSPRYNLSVALRQAVGESWTFLVPYGALSLFGVRPRIVELSRSVNLLYQYWVHTEIIDKLGPFEIPMNTPSHHRVHHGVNRKYIDRNHGGILIVWDRLFGTFRAEEERPTYGITKPLGTDNLGTIVFREFADIARDVVAANGWRERLSSVFRGPGWAYDREKAAAVNELNAA